MNTLEIAKSITFKNILVATDFSDASKHALQCAAAITDLTDAKLFVLHAVPPRPHLPVPLDPLPASADLDLIQAQHNFERTTAYGPVSQVRHEEVLERGPVPQVVLEAIRKEKIDLLVLGTHGRTGLSKLVLGSVAEELFRRAPCPVLTVGPSALRARHQLRKVLFATDFGPSSRHALPYAIEFANQVGGELTMLHLVSPVPVEYVGPFWYPGPDVVEREEASRQKGLEQLRQLLPSNAGLKCKVDHLVEFRFAPEGILQLAHQRDIDVIVIGVRESGTKAPRLAAHMPWAVAHELVCRAECPVLTVRA